MENISTSTLTTVGGWAVIIGVGGYIYYRAQHKAGRRQPANRSSSSHARIPTGDYEKSVASAATATKKKAEKALKPKPKPAPSTTTANADTAKTTGADYDAEAEAAANKRANDEFARQYANAKSGTKFETTKRDDKKAKSIKQSRAREIEVPDDKISVPSSTTGDADDDLSEANSPEVKAADGRDVSDMLEQTSPGPSVMRITDTEAVKAKQKKEKKAEVVESKKQRQNRKKAEAAKAAREEEEVERKKLEEAQRRQARIAEGRAAKDGSGFMAAANKESVWKGKPEEESAKRVELLDTEEQKPAAPKLAPKAANESAPKPSSSATNSSWMSAVPSEEEQMKLLQDEDSWNEVTTKKSKRGKKATDSSANLASSTENVAATATPAAAPAPKAPVNGNSKTTKPTLSSSSSFAALTPDETTDDNEIEEEWEV
ncbi:hypothetical protein PG993_004289 [Apiospora rasikravindrae]|uniref:Uncharacterized protein n=1 Tax=Apiospora rasikravindrae TaxID=990691 RepID=A0ABR1TCB0_9PEZI